MSNIETIENSLSENTFVNIKNSGFWANRILARIGKAKFGQIQVSLPNGQTVAHKGKFQGQFAHVTFHTWKSLFRYVFLGQLAFVEEFMDGDVSIADLPSLIHWFVDNEKYFPEKINNTARDMINRFFHLVLNDNSKSGSRENISFHYDLGNDFYKKWLDDTMTYSSGLFRDTDTLKGSQQTKYQRIIDQLDVCPDDQVLEIGCGWGGFAEQLLSQQPVDYRGITISQEQLDYAKDRLEKVSVKKDLVNFEDYRDTEGKFDKIVSIEMFEAVGEKHWDQYFKTVKERLRQNGKAVIQVITIDESRFDLYRNRVDFIQKYIFPGGMLPSKTLFREYAEENQFKITDEFAFGQDYAKTMKVWKEKFLANWSDIEPMGFDDRFYRTWLYYLDYCIAAFERGAIDVVHFTMTHDLEKEDV